MRLKWLPVRLRRRRGGPVGPRLLAADRPGGPPTTLHFCGEPANGGCPRPRRAPWEGSPAFAWGTYSPAPGRSGDATEERCESLAHCSAGPFGLGRSSPAGGRGGHCFVGGRRRLRWPGGRPVAPCAVVVGARMAASDPSKTRTGVQHACESRVANPWAQ